MSSEAIAGHELALAQAEAMIERQADELQRLRDENAGLREDAERYRHMRGSAEFQDRNGPGAYWYLPRWDRSLPLGDRLDAAIDAAMRKGE